MTARALPDEAQGPGEPLLEIDRQVCAAFEPYSKKPPVKALAFVSQIGDQLPMRLLAGSLLAAGLLLRKPRLATAGGRMLASHEVATLAKDAIKRRIDRRRPNSEGDEHDHRPTPGRKRAKRDTSFPSGHSAGAMAGAAALAAVYPEHRAAALGAGVATGLAQVPSCAHYPSDVAAGLAIGAAADGLVGMVLRALRP